MEGRIPKSITLILSLFLIFGLSSDAICKEAKKDVMEFHRPPQIQKVLSVDLVVTKVRMKRGTFAGQRKIQIIPCVKNLKEGRTSTRIKILLDGLALAEWIEGGIGPKEEKCGGALYVLDAGGTRSLHYSVVVDNNNTINESNELNNRCINVRFGSSDTKKEHICFLEEGPY